MTKTKKDKIELIKIKLVRNQSTYFPRPRGDIWYGVVFDRTAEHVTIKSIRADIEGNIVYGTVDRFMIGDISIEKLSPDTLIFVPEEPEKQK